MHDKSLWQHDPAIFLEFEFPFFYFNYNVTCENPDDYIFTGNSGKPRKFHENNVNDFTYHRAFLVMILESFWVTIIIMPHLLYSFAFYVSDAIFYIPSHDSRLKGRRVDRSGGFATKSVFHEASRVSLMVMLMEIWHQWRTVEEWKSATTDTIWLFATKCSLQQHHLDGKYLILQYPAVYPFPKVMTHHLNRFSTIEVRTNIQFTFWRENSNLQKNLPVIR